VLIGAGALAATAAAGAPMNHVALLGDSVFDNRAYVGGGPDVIRQLREALPSGWTAALGAVDGAVIGSVHRQATTLTQAPSHVVISAGGNDALVASSVLQERAGSVAEALLKIAGVAREFRASYAAMLDGLKTSAAVAVCTIYDPRFPTREERLVSGTALAALNDCITREAFARGLTLIDLRLVCGDDADFANAIEPSVQGGRKIAQAIASFVTDAQGSRVIAR
jgi:hypothetical protein